MKPALKAGQLIIATGIFKDVRPGDVVVIKHDGKEKIKRIAKLEDGHVYVLGDNPESSTDSRDFGWLTTAHIEAKVVWPKIKTV
jgi:phage repressor protein C with HTH and peptisase S24 domain